MWFLLVVEAVRGILVPFLLVLLSKAAQEDVITIVALHFTVDVFRREVEVLAVAFAAQKEEISHLPEESNELISLKFLVGGAFGLNDLRESQFS